MVTIWQNKGLNWNLYSIQVKQGSESFNTEEHEIYDADLK